jgi:hypothetical protein
MRRALSTRSCAGRTHVGAVSLRESASNATTRRAEAFRRLRHHEGESAVRLFYSPGACSLADHVALNEADLTSEHERVDLKRKTTASRADFTAISPFA